MNVTPQTSESSNCLSCGAVNDAGNLFCTECGYSLTGGEAAAPMESADTRLLDGPPDWERAYQTQVTVDKREADVARGEIRLGRTSGDFQVPGDPYLSSTHAAIRKDEQGYHLIDLESKNGTFVRIREQAGIATGDSFMVGSQRFRLRPWKNTDLVGATAPSGLNELPEEPDALAAVAGGRISRSEHVGYSLARIVEDGSEGEVYPLPARGLTIGRRHGDVVFPSDGLLSDPHVSLQAIEHAEYAFLIRDEGSRNGVYLRIRGAWRLQPGDMFAVGRQLMVFDPEAT